jgi:hypothetical protein
LVSMYFWTIAKICAYVIPVLLAHLTCSRKMSATSAVGL